MNDIAVQDRHRPVLIAVPFFRNEHLVETLVASLRRCAADAEAIGGEVVFYNDSPDHAPLCAALAGLAASDGLPPVRVETNVTNLGFVQTMNRAVAEAVARSMDLLVLNSDTQLTPGALPEMLRVMRLDTMHGFVNPRSDNATIATLPVQARMGGRVGADAWEVYAQFATRLPPFSYVPTAVGYCLLIRWEILAEFGGFDEIYGKGYNEENDLVMRASRVGYRAVLANHAFVAHLGEASFSLADVPRTEWEKRNRAILDARYPEYAGHTRRYYDTPEVTAERLLACLVPDASGLLDVALDCSSFVAARNGTFQAGRQLIEAAARAWQGRFRVHVLCSPGVFEFHDYGALGVTRSDPHDCKCFAAIFRIGQPYDWNTLQRLCMRGAVLGVYMLDTISLDCPTLASAQLENLWQFTMDHFDVLATQSRQTDRSMRLRLRVPADMISVVAPHSLDLADYLPAAELPPDSGQTLLVVGNHYAHKHVAPTTRALAAAFPHRRIVAMGITPLHATGAPESDDAPAELTNVACISLGKAAESEIAALYADAAAVIFPSFAEGFGFPTLNALAAGRPLFARRLPATEEIWIAHARNPNIHFYDTTAELLTALQDTPAWHHVKQPDTASPQSAVEIGDALDAAMQRISYTRVVARVQAMQFASDVGKNGVVAEVDPPAIAASLVAARIERAMRHAFNRPMLFRATRMAVRAVRRVFR